MRYQNETMRRLPLPLGTKVPPYGYVAAVMFIGGERYYSLVKGTDVALMPWSVIEPPEPQEAPE